MGIRMLAIAQLGFALLLTLTPSLRAQVIVESQFDDGPEGWTYVDTLEPTVLLDPEWIEDGGSESAGDPGAGFIQGEDPSDGSWYFVAPETFFDVPYGAALQFDQRTEGPGDPTEGDLDIIIVAGDAADVVWVCSIPGVPTEEWTERLVHFSTESPWRDPGDDSLATPAELDSALQSLVRIAIQGEYRTGVDTSGLDNVVLACSGDCQTRFVRGDVNQDGSMDIADPILTLSILFVGAEETTCSDAMDANDDGALDLADAIATLSNLFAGGPALPAPFGLCGIDPTVDDGLECEAFAICP